MLLSESDGRVECGEGVEENDMGHQRWRRSSHEGTPVNLALEDDLLVERERSSQEDAGGPDACVKVVTPVGCSQQWCVVGNATGKVGGWKRRGWIREMVMNPLGKDEMTAAA